MTDDTQWPQQAETISRFYGKGKEQPLGDGSWMTLCPLHKDSNKPNLHVTPSDNGIMVYCHVCGDGKQEELYRTISSEYLLSVKPAGQKKTLSKNERGLWIKPITAGAPHWPDKCYLGPKYGYRTPDDIWAYENQSKQILFFNTRFNVIGDDGSSEKIYRRLALYVSKREKDAGLPAWSWYGPDTDLPLYGLEQLTGEWWNKKILFVEGEKAADAAAKVFKDAVVLAYGCGAQNYTRVDWSPLVEDQKVHTVYLWPDNDAAGKAMAHGVNSLSTFLKKKYGINTMVVDVFSLPDLPKKWDLADPLPAGWDTDTLYKLLDAAIPAEVLDQERTLQNCEMLRKLKIKTAEEFLERSKTSCDKYSRDKDSPCQQCLLFRRIERPADIASTPDLFLDWVYLSSHNCYYNLKTRAELQPAGFNAVWAAKPTFTHTGKESAIPKFQTDSRACKVSDYTYEPGNPVIAINKHGKTNLNLWRGFSLKPDYSEQPELWTELAVHLFPEEFIREHILDWLAFTVQNPALKINHGLLIISETQGIGKDSFIQPMRDILGEDNYKDISSRQLDEPFNEYLLHTKLLVVSELDTIGHRRSTYDHLKSITSAPPPTLSVNIKNMRPIVVPNIVHTVAFSNKETPIVLDDCDRRFFVYRSFLTKADMLSTEWFQNYYDWLKSGGSRKVFGYLMKRDVSKFAYGKAPPATEAKTLLAARGRRDVAELQVMIDNYLPPFHRDLFTLDELTKESKTFNLSHAASIFPGLGIKKVKRVRLESGRHYLYACRSLDFWMQQPEAILKRGYLERWVDGNIRSEPKVVQAVPDSYSRASDLPF